MRRLAPLALTLLLVSTAHAQYVWIDANGHRQHSDRPPPPSTPTSKILKAPKTAPTREEVAPAPTSDTDGKKSGPPTLAERNTEYNKRKAEQAEKSKKAEDEARRATEIAANCDNARQAKRSLDSGARVAITNANGERDFMSDQQRAAENAKVQRVLDPCNQADQSGR